MYRIVELEIFNNMQSNRNSINTPIKHTHVELLVYFNKLKRAKKHLCKIYYRIDYTHIQIGLTVICSVKYFCLLKSSCLMEKKIHTTR